MADDAALWRSALEDVARELDVWAAGRDTPFPAGLARTIREWLANPDELRGGRVMRRVEFRLSMPGRASWNGRWSGEGRNYVLVRSVRDSVAVELDGQSWRHQWGDGWAASISARVLQPGERVAKSDGFCGYDWMVRNILTHGSPYDPDDARAAEPAQRRGEGGE